MPTGRPAVEFIISKVDQPGGAWQLARVEYGENRDTGEPSIRTDLSAYTTLAHARASIVRELRLPKRVRLTKINSGKYRYVHRLGA